MFKSGDSFPGDAHKDRQEEYKAARDILRGRYDQAFGIEGVRRITGLDYGNNVTRELLERLINEVTLIFNLPRLIEDKFASMVTDGIRVVAAEKSAQDALDEALEASQWSLVAPRLAFHAGAYGNALVTGRRMEDATIRVDLRPTWTWYPVVDAYDAGLVTEHTFAWVYDEPGDDGESFLLQETYAPGYIYRQANELTGPRGSRTIGPAVEFSRFSSLPAEEPTEIERPLVAVFSNPIYDAGIFGQSDVESDNQTLANEISARMSQISRILNVHADPKLTGPEDVLSRSKVTSEPEFNVSGSRYLPRRDGDPEYSYLTWDTKLEHAFAALDRDVESLCVAMHMCPDLVGLGDRKAGVEATETLRIRAYNTTTRVNLKRDYYTAGCKDMADLVFQLAGQESPGVTVEYGDPLPTSRLEMAKAIQAEKMAGVISLERAIRSLNPDMTDEEVTAELESIRRDEQPSMLDPGEFRGEEES